VDVLDKKNRIERQQEHKKDRIRDEAVHNQSRINTLVNLKSQIVQQRKARIAQQSSLKGRALNLRNIPVGPGQYEVNRDATLNEIPVPKFSVLGHDDGVGAMGVELGGEKAPPPGTYSVSVLPSGTLN
jgi:hypothetical protein